MALLIAFSAAGFVLAAHGPAGLDTAPLLWLRDASHTGQLAGPAWMENFWLGVSWLGDAVPRITVAGLAIVALSLARRWRSALCLAGILLSGIMLSTVLKYWIARPRPTLVAHLVAVHSASFPSGHALNSTLFYLGTAFFLAGLFRCTHLRRLVYGIAAALTLATGVARVALGVHYPTDVIGGWVIGFAWLWLWLIAAWRWWPKALPPRVTERPDPAGK